MINFIYLVSAIFFILGLKGLTSPKTAVKGNQLSAIGMFIAIVTTILYNNLLNIEWILIALIVGGLIGTLLAVKVQMTSMPQMVALLNGFGGIASVLVGVSAFMIFQNPSAQFNIALSLTEIIGSVTFFGSIVAAAKLHRIISEKPIYFNGIGILNIIIAISILVSGSMFVFDPLNLNLLILIIILASVLGLTIVLPIGGADMPIVVAILNSYSGLASAATGFVLGNSILIISGSLVGASGLILTQIMCKAMNRSFINIIFGKPSSSAKRTNDDEFYKDKVKSSSSEEAAMIMETASNVVIVPGYGLAIAQAQYLVKELESELEKHNIDVKYAIHPVAGRMPGHMNVLLAEAYIDYEKLVDLDRINPEFQNTDVVLVLGANDVINPAANTSKDSPIYGMPILNVGKAKTTIVVKRSLSPGFAGIPNELFIRDNTVMIFGDAKEVVGEIVKEFREM